MSKGRFEPGKRVLLLRGTNQNPNTQHLVGTEQRLLAILPSEFDYKRNCPRWQIDGVLSLIGVHVAWSQKCMIPLDDPDLESTEESAEAMRRITSIPSEVTA